MDQIVLSILLFVIILLSVIFESQILPYVYIIEYDETIEEPQNIKDSLTKGLWIGDTPILVSHEQIPMCLVVYSDYMRPMALMKVMAFKLWLKNPSKKHAILYTY